MTATKQGGKNYSMREANEMEDRLILAILKKWNVYMPANL